MSDIALRKKKNADAQAAFRARRANYITTLEETVNNLEEVVLQIQDSYRDKSFECNELRQENTHLKFLLREREREFTLLLPANRLRQRDDLPQSSFVPNPATLSGHFDVYRADHAQSMQYCPPPGPTSPPPPFPVLGNEDSQSPLVQRGVFNPAHREWLGAQPPDSQARHRQSPTTTDSTPVVSPIHEQNISIEGAAYAFPSKPPSSPSPSSPRSAGPSQPSLYQYPFSETPADQKDTSFEPAHFRSSYLPPEGDDILSTSPISTKGQVSPAGFIGSGNAVHSTHPSLQLLPVPQTLPPPQSPSPDITNAPLSSTLAVIKTHSFGGLRRPRARAKKSVSPPTTMVLSGSPPGNDGSGSSGSKRQRIDEGSLESFTRY